MIKCRVCNSENLPGQTFCSSCGALLLDPLDSFTKVYKVAILFGDIAGFTALSEKLDPEVITRILDIFLSKVLNIVREKGGFINRLVGDEFMAVFGFPIFEEESVFNALESAIEILEFLEQQDLTKITGGRIKRISLRQGLETGPVTVGVEQNEKSSLIFYGDTVYFASHLEKAGKINKIIVGENAYNILNKKYAFAPLEKKGIIGYTMLM